jgi:Flp pilus assembly protein TadD
MEDILRRSYPSQLWILLLAAMSAGAQVDNPTTPQTLTPGLTVTSSVPHAEERLPKLAPDQFTDCYAMNGPGGMGSALSLAGFMTCQLELARDQRIVIEKSMNHDGKTAPRVSIQACSELLDRDIVHGHDRFYLLVDRAIANFSLGDRQHALDDYNAAVQAAPKNAQPYYYRGVFYAVQSDVDAALRDFDTALSLDPKLVAALLQRAKLHCNKKDLGGALADYSEAIRLKPEAADAWSERGYVRLFQRDYDNAIQDESQAIKLDPKLARAYFLRGAAYGDRGDSSDAVRDIVTAVGLDPLLDKYISSKGKTATLALPPL